MELRKSEELYLASGTLRFTGISDLDYPSILRGIHGGGIECSLLIETGKSCNTFLTVFSKDESKKRACQMIQYREDTLKNLFRSCTLLDSSMPQILRKKCSALIFILGKPGIQLASDLIGSLSSMNVHLCLNLLPTDMDTELEKDISDTKRAILALKKENTDRTLELHRDWLNLSNQTLAVPMIPRGLSSNCFCSGTEMLLNSLSGSFRGNNCMHPFFP
jgi:hypothetical protein